MQAGRVAAYRGRLIAARERLAELPELGAGTPGQPDPTTGERWDRLNVLGHMG